MLQKIEDHFKKVYNYIKNHFRDVVIWLLALAALFCLGDKLGWNELVAGKANDLFVYLSTRKALMVNLVLAIGSTISAIFAVIISIRANRISKIALEIESPKLVFNYTRSDDRKPYSFKVSNTGNSDAINCQFRIINRKKEIKYLDEYRNISISAGISDVELFFVPTDEEKQAIIVTYTNLNSGKIYKRGFEIKLSGLGVKQIGFQEDSVLSFQEYLTLS